VNKFQGSQCLQFIGRRDHTGKLVVLKPCHWAKIDLEYAG